MDDRRFDALTKSLARGASRRSVLKGLLGLGGAALAGSVVLDGDTEAARRAKPTPKPSSCPGIQTWDDDAKVCVCPPNLTQCNPGGGPTCCNDQISLGPGYSECCDNACCQYPYDCVAEELCCPRLPAVGCLDDRGRCCSTCCVESNDSVACVDLTSDGACCTDAECGDDPCVACDPETHTCGPRCDESTEVCCTDQAGPGRCQKGACCPGAPCPTKEQFCCPNPDDGGRATCRFTSSCCTVDTDCDTGCQHCLQGVCTKKCQSDDCCQAATNPADWFCVEGDRCCSNDDCNTPPDLCSTGVCGDDHLCHYTGCDTGQKCCGPISDLCVPEGTTCCTVEYAFSGVAALQVLPSLCGPCMICNDYGYCVPVDNGQSCSIGSDDDDSSDGSCCGGVCIEDAECCDDGDCSAVDACTPAECLSDHTCKKVGTCIASLCCEADGHCYQCCDSDDCDSDQCLECQEGVCGSYCLPGWQCDGSGGCCLPVESGCSVDINCCSGLVCDGGFCRTCRSNGGFCSTDDDCCSGLCQDDSQVCVSCKVAQGTCTPDGNECCNQYFCSGGLCYHE